MKIFVNDKLVSRKKAVVSVFDHGFLYGDGVFETLRAYNGTVFKINEHLRRLKRSASLIDLRLPYNNKDLSGIIYRTIEENGLKEAYIRITVTRGEGEIGLDPSLCPAPGLIVIAKSFQPYPETAYRKGIKVIVSRIKRNIKEAIDPEIKSMNFLNNILAKMEAKKKNAFEAIMLNEKGYVTEGTISNIFIVKKNIIRTPSIGSGILNGITRQTVLRLAAKKGIKVVEGNIRPTELHNADEVFITNTTLEVMPVSRVDDSFVKTGDISSLLREEYGKEVSRATGSPSRRTP